ncbi:MAG: MlaD family protein [Cyanobacteria bacterium]|nr:MlaD family protein [Cyanobacteriota bacterium]MDA1245770.1 MlaD family protein [Cyanobacteriota bacterium]
MRRSIREAVIGLSLLAAISSAVGLSFWLRGISLSRQNWSVKASFAEASGLAERSPVTYRGVLIGSVRRVTVTPGAVVAELEIVNGDLNLARPTRAEIGAASLLGGEAEVALISSGPALPPGSPNPRSKACNNSIAICNGASIAGIQGPSLTSVTGLLHKMLMETDQLKLLSKVDTAASSFERTAKETSALMKDGRNLVKEIDSTLKAAQPTITNLNSSSAHLRRVLAALDNPQTLKNLQATVSNAEQLTAKWNSVGGDVTKLTDDPRFMDGIRSVAVGLGKFFDELYPAAKSR